MSPILSDWPLGLNGNGLFCECGFLFAVRRHPATM